MATFAARHEHSEARYFEILANSPTDLWSPPSSYISAAAHLTFSAARSFAYTSAMGNWTPWLLPIALSKTTLLFAYSTLFRTNHLASPMHSDASRILSGLSTSRM